MKIQQPLEGRQVEAEIVRKRRHRALHDAPEPRCSAIGAEQSNSSVFPLPRGESGISNHSPCAYDGRATRNHGAWLWMTGSSQVGPRADLPARQNDGLS